MKEIRIKVVFADEDELTPEERNRMETASRMLDADVTRIIGKMLEGMSYDPGRSHGTA